jgi:hypothetical protein
MFRRLDIENFRGIRKAEISDLSRINLFFGKNNCGKSSVLESIFLITGQSNPVLPVTANAMRGIGKFSEQSMMVDFYGADISNQIHIIADGDERRELTIEMIQSDSHDVVLRELSPGQSDTAMRHYGLKSTYKLDGNATQYNSEVVISKDNDENGKIGIDKRYKETLFSQFIPSSYLQDTMTDKLAKIIKNKREGEILEVLRIVEPRLRDIQLVGQEIMADVGLSQRLPINVLGDGIRKILCIILAVYNCANGVLIIDEIDNGLHYSVMKNMWRAVIASAKVYNVQLFVSTHNLDLLKGLSGYLEETDSEGDRPLVSAYKLIRKADDEIVSLYYDYDNLSYSIQQEIEMR